MVLAIWSTTELETSPMEKITLFEGVTISPMAIAMILLEIQITPPESPIRSVEWRTMWRDMWTVSKGRKIVSVVQLTASPDSKIASKAIWTVWTVLAIRFRARWILWVGRTTAWKDLEIRSKGRTIRWLAQVISLPRASQLRMSRRWWRTFKIWSCRAFPKD